MARKLIVEVIGDSSSLDKALGKSTKQAQGFGSTLGSVAKTAGLAAGAAGIGAIAITLKAGYGEWVQSQKVAAQTGAVLKSTGGIANVTAKHVDELGRALLRKTGADDEAIKSGENMLLTFKNIRNEAGQGNNIFDQTTQTLTDMTAALHGGDLSTEALRKQAIQLGKAMNDPIKGLSALRRVGVTFTDDQKNMIEQLVNTGHAMDAQKLILKELNSEFGGSAEAIGKTLPGQINILKEEFNNFAGDLVGRMIPAIQTAIGWLRDHWPEISAALKAMWESVKPILANLRDLIVTTVEIIKEHWGSIGPVVMGVARIVQDMAKIVGGAIKLVTDLLKGDWSAAWHDAVGIVKAVFDEIKTYLTVVIGIVLGIATKIGEAFVDGMRAGLRLLGSVLIALVKAPFNAIITAWNAIGFEFDIPEFDTHVPGVGKIGGGHLSFHTPQIPTLDTGGYITGTGIAMVHKGETIVPAGAGGNTYVTVNVPVGFVGSEQQLADVIVRTLQRRAASMPAGTPFRTF